MRFFDGGAVRSERSTGTVTGSALTALVLAVGLVLALSFIPGANVASADPSASDWQRLRVCESGDNYTINTGNGYYGAYQFDLGTWKSVGGTGYPHQAARATQDALALELWRQRGWTPWACASIVGLTGGAAGVKGSFDSAAASTATARVVGWAYDAAASSASIRVRIAVNGVSALYTADKGRSDVNRTFAISGNHGYVANVALRPATNNEICVWAVGTKAGTERSLGCRSVRPVAAQPKGSVDSMVPTNGVASVKGWTFDPNVPGTSNRVHIYVNGTGYSRLADKGRSDVNRTFGITGNHGFSETVPLKTGSNQVCVHGIDLSGDNNSLLRCQEVVTRYPPTGAFDKLSASGLTGSLNGWVLDPNVPSASIRVHVYVNGTGYAFTADRLRADVNRVKGVTGNHGFSVRVPLRAGSNDVCVYAIGTAGGNNALVSCRTVSATAPAAQRLAAAAETPAETSASTSAADTAAGGASATAPTVSSGASSGASSGPSAGSSAVSPTTGQSAAAAKSSASLTVPTTAPGTLPSTSTPALPPVGNIAPATAPTATSSPGATGFALASRTGAPPSTVLTTPTATPRAKGALETLVLNGRAGTLTGWIADPAAGPAGTWVRITVNGVTHDVLASTARTDVQNPGGATPLGFIDTIRFAAGSNEVCLFEIDKAGGLSSAPIGCTTEVVT